MNKTIVYQVRKIGAWNVYYRKDADVGGVVGAHIRSVIREIKANGDFFSVESMPGYVVDMEEVKREVHS